MKEMQSNQDDDSIEGKIVGRPPSNTISTTYKNSNKRRRELYSHDEEYRELAKQRSRDTYRKANPKRIKKPIEQVHSKNKAVNILGKTSPICMDVFTLPKSAKFLNKSIITFRRWIHDKIIPPPYSILYLI